MDGNNIKYINKYLAYKINKICWNDSSLDIFQMPSVFATGSWDENENTLDFWSLQSNDSYENQILNSTIENDIDNIKMEEEIVPICSVNINANITGIEFLKDNLLLASTSAGNLNLMQFDLPRKSIEIKYVWNDLHCLGVKSTPCTSFAVSKNTMDQCVATVGEDGGLSIISDLNAMRNSKLLKCKIDGTVINDVKFLNEQIISTVNSIGQLKNFDRRLDLKTPQQIFNITTEHQELYSLDQHPTCMYMLACGGFDGNLYIIDTRMTKTPAALHSGHSYDLMQVKFHESYPNNIFTCSGEGSGLHWRCDDLSLPVDSEVKINSQKSEYGESKFEIENLMEGNLSPINCLDINSNRLICGGDGGLLTYINGLYIH